MNASSSTPAMTTTTAQPVLHTGIWDIILEQLAVRGDHGTLANCTRLNKELSELASRHLYSAQFCPPRYWGGEATESLWANLSADMLVCEEHPDANEAFPATYHPYLLFKRHLNLLNFLSVHGCRPFPDQRFVTVNREAAQQDPGSTTDQSIVAANHVTAETPSIGCFGTRLLRKLAHMSTEKDLHVMLKSLTADWWMNVQPVIHTFRKLEILSLVFLDDLDKSAAELITTHLPMLTKISVVQADDSEIASFADFVSELPPTQLRSFDCSLNQTQMPLLEAIAQHTCLQELTLQFVVCPPFELHRLFELTDLTSLTLSFNYQPSPQNRLRFKRWAEENRGKVTDWLKSCQALRSLHLFRFPDLVPAVADALPHLHLRRLHIFSTGCYEGFYEALETQQLEYLFLAECSEEGLVNPTSRSKERGEIVMKAVTAMPCLRDLRLHTYSTMDCSALDNIAKHVPKLQTLSFVCRKGENSTWTLRALEGFKHLTSLTVLGHTKFSSREILYWVSYMHCHQRPGGFRLSLPAQDPRSWYRGMRAPAQIVPSTNDPATATLKQVLKWLAVFGRERHWRGNDYEAEEERMFVQLWGDARGPAEGLQLLRGSGPYAPWSGLMHSTDFCGATMAVLNFTLSEDAVAAFRDVLACLNKFSDEVSLEAKKDKLVLTALNASKSAYSCFTFTTNRFCSRYQFEGSAQYRDKFYCTLYTRSLASIFRSRAGGDPQRDREKESTIDRCDVAIEDGPGVKSRFIVKLVFRNGVTSTHRLPFEVVVPVHAKFDRDEAIHHWTIPSRTLRQLMEHFGPGVELLDINSDGEHVNFTCYTEKTTNGDEVLKKPLHTSIAIEVDEFEDIEVEDKLRIVISVKDFRAIIQHAGITGNHISARYSNPARPILFTYPGDGITCEFLLMTVGEKGNPAQKTKKGKAKGAQAAPQQQLEAASRRQSAAPSETPQPQEQPTAQSMPPPALSASASRSGIAARTSLFDLRPSQRPPPATMASQSLFVDDQDEQAWEPVRYEEDDDPDLDARLGWDHSNQPTASSMHLDRKVAEENAEFDPTPASSAGLEPTQRLDDVRRLGLFYQGP
ncbi:hypothetical protein CNYM01_04604 [Colletotrichum nymphaeae SA-01]|uniref:DNA repair protein rad9 n=1 Tax=Colletotrichum nymphaeae SA-01 TaxID=1460502 RepID=A0A135SYW5_9PEZI|nr:hypothetical protein CNYM01_04604 [Colletotrichum nymphaeae SA-01]